MEKIFSEGDESILATVNPIRELKKIEAIKKILQNSARDLTLFVFGINSSLRISDILNLNVSDVLDGKGRIRKAITLYEKKTGKPKQFPLNDSITDALKAYIKREETHALDEPLFVSTHGRRLSYSQAWRVMKAAGESVGLEHIGTHSLRKTFGYHVYKKTAGNLGLVQKLLNHGSSGDTIKYIGIDQEQMDDVYLKLNL